MTNNNWYADHGLAVLITQWRAMHPGCTVGTIGDAAHQAEVSDHNPDPDGSVDAADFMAGPGGVTAAQLAQLAEALRAGRDPRIKYVIWGRRIFSSTISPWEWRPYSGAPHTHVHVSVNDNHTTDTRSWELGGMDVTPEVVKGIQDALRAAGYDPGPSDGQWGPKTQAALVAALKGRTGPAGPIGRTGPAGPPGRDATYPARVTITGTINAVAVP